MITVNVKELVSAIEEAGAFKLPDKTHITRIIPDSYCSCICIGG